MKLIDKLNNHLKDNYIYNISADKSFINKDCLEAIVILDIEFGSQLSETFIKKYITSDDKELTVVTKVSNSILNTLSRKVVKEMLYDVMCICASELGYHIIPKGY